MQPNQSANMEFLAQAALIAGAEFLNGQTGSGGGGGGSSGGGDGSDKSSQMMFTSRQALLQAQAEACGGVVIDGGRFKCRRCTKAFAKLGSLEKHAILHTDQSPFKCQHCHRGFPKPSVLKRHMNVHFKAPEMARKRRSGERRRGYDEEEEDDDDEDDPVIIGSRIIIDEDDEEEDEEEEEEDGSTRKKFKCEYCWQSFVFEENLVRHKLKHTQASPFKCSTCHKPFTKQSRLVRHEKIHRLQPSVEEVNNVDEEEEEGEDVDVPSRNINDDVEAILAASGTKKRGKQTRKTGGRKSSGYGKQKGRKRKATSAKSKQKR